jgi:hypothetical protein
MDKLPIMSVIHIDMIYSPPGPIVHLAMACSPENMVNETHTHTQTQLRCTKKIQHLETN